MVGVGGLEPPRPCRAARRQGRAADGPTRSRLRRNRSGMPTRGRGFRMPQIMTKETAPKAVSFIMVGVGGLEPPALPRCATSGPCGRWPHSLPASPEPLGDADKRPGVLRSFIQKEKDLSKTGLSLLVGVGGLEPPASWSRTKHATDCATPRYRRECIIL